MAIKFSELKVSELTLDDTLHTGKYAGCSVREVMEHKASYLIWMAENDYLTFDKATIVEIKAYKHPEDTFTLPKINILPKDYFDNDDIPF